MDRLKAQASVETMLIFLGLLTVFTIVFLTVIDTYQERRVQTQQGEAAVTVEKLANAASELCRSPQGSVRSIRGTFPSLANNEQSEITEKRIVFHIQSGDVSESVFATTDCTVSGNLPPQSGAYSFQLTRRNNYVAIDYTPQSRADPTVETDEATNVGKTTATLNGNLTDLGGHSEINVFFQIREDGESDWGESGRETKTTTGAFDSEATLLDEGTTYEYRAGGEWNDGNEQVFGSITTFTTDPPDDPVVTTDSAENITTGNATLHGNLTSLGDDNFANVSFQYNNTEDNDIQWTNTTPENRSTTGQFNHTGTDFLANTTYEYRAYAQWNTDGGTSNGTVKTFTTKPHPSVRTDNVDNIGAHTATLHGNLTEMGDASFINVSFQHREQGAATWTNTTEQNKSETGAYTEDVTGLTADTTHEYRAMAEWNNEENQTFGATQTFTTEPVEPQVETQNPDNVGQDSARLHGELTALGAESFANISFQYRADGASTWTNTTPENTSSETIFNETLTGLSSGTTHEYRAYTQWNTSGGNNNGSLKTFTTTSAGTPNINTKGTSSITTHSAVLHGNVTTLGDENWIHAFFQYNNTENTTEVVWMNTTRQNRSSIGEYTENITELDDNTTYEYRAAANWSTSLDDSGTPATFTTELASCSSECSDWEAQECGGSLNQCDGDERLYTRDCPDDRNDCSESTCSYDSTCESACLTECDDDCGSNYECGTCSLTTCECTTCIG